jgi:hypothetical protein
MAVIINHKEDGELVISIKEGNLIDLEIFRMIVNYFALTKIINPNPYGEGVINRLTPLAIAVAKEDLKEVGREDGNAEDYLNRQVEGNVNVLNNWFMRRSQSVQSIQSGQDKQG